jgi:hypothetical protein
MLKEISDSEDVIEVTGEYTGGLGGYGASHEHRAYDKRRMITTAATTATTTPEATASPAKKILQQQEIKRPAYEKPAARQRGKNYKITIYTAAGIAGAIALAGFIIS